MKKEKLICKNCGNEITKDFCTNCSAGLRLVKDKASLFHFGPNGLEVESGKIKERMDGSVEFGNKTYEPLNIPLKTITYDEMIVFFKWMEDGEDLFKKGKFEDAIELFDKCIDFLPLAPKPLLMKAGVLINMKKFDDVEGLIEEAMQFGSQMEQLWTAKAVLMLSTDEIYEGYRCLLKALEINPQSMQAKATMRQLKGQSPNDFAYLLPDLKAPIKKGYELFYDLLNSLNESEWISLRTVFDVGIKVKIIEKLDIEFQQSDFKEYLPKIFYTILLRKGYFWLSIGKLNAPENRTLLFGDMEDLLGLSFFSMFETLEGQKLPPPLYKSIEEKYKNLKESWDVIWSGVSVRNNYLFYNLEVLEDYLQELKLELN